MFDTLPLLFSAPLSQPVGEGADAGASASVSGDFADILSGAIAEEGEAAASDAEESMLEATGFPVWMAPALPEADVPVSEPAAEASAPGLRDPATGVSAQWLPARAEFEVQAFDAPQVSGERSMPAPRTGDATVAETETPVLIDELLARWKGGAAPSPNESRTPITPIRTLPPGSPLDTPDGALDGKALPPPGKALPLVDEAALPVARPDVDRQPVGGPQPPAVVDGGTDLTVEPAVTPSAEVAPTVSSRHGDASAALPPAAQALVHEARASETLVFPLPTDRVAVVVPTSGPRPGPKAQPGSDASAVIETPAPMTLEASASGTGYLAGESAFGLSPVAAETTPTANLPWVRDPAGMAPAAPAGPLHREPTAASAEPAQAPAASQHIELPLAHPRWSDAMASRVVWFARQEFQHAQLQLSPAELGPIDIALSIHGAEASVAFSAQHASTREALEQSIPRLRELFAQNGVQLGQVDVSAQTDRGEKNWQERGGQPAEGPRADAVAKEEAVRHAPPPVRVAAGRIDYFA